MLVKEGLHRRVGDPLLLGWRPYVARALLQRELGLKLRKTLLGLLQQKLLFVGLEREGQPLDAVFISVPSDFSPRLGRWVNPDVEPTELLVNLAEQRPSSYGDPSRILVPLKTRVRRGGGGGGGGGGGSPPHGAAVRATPPVATMPADGMARLVAD